MDAGPRREESTSEVVDTARYGLRTDARRVDRAPATEDGERSFPESGITGILPQGTSVPGEGSHAQTTGMAPGSASGHAPLLGSVVEAQPRPDVGEWSFEKSEVPAVESGSGWDPSGSTVKDSTCAGFRVPSGLDHEDRAGIRSDSGVEPVPCAAVRSGCVLRRPERPEKRTVAVSFESVAPASGPAAVWLAGWATVVGFVCRMEETGGMVIDFGSTFDPTACAVA